MSLVRVANALLCLFLAQTAALADQTDPEIGALEALDRIVRTINEESSLQELLALLLDQAFLFAPQAEKGTFLMAYGEGAMRLAAVNGYDPSLVDNLELTVEEAISRYTESGEQLAEGVYIVRQFGDLAGQEKLEAFETPAAMVAMAAIIDGNHGLCPHCLQRLYPHISGTMDRSGEAE